MRSEDVLNEQFRATKYTVGYDQQEVDHFLDRVIDTLRTYEDGAIPDQPLTAQHVHSVRFAPTRYREGYEPQDVDRFLERLAEAFQDRERGEEH